MGKGILRINADIIAEWFVAGKTKDDVKDLLKLPESHEIEDIAMDDTGQHVCLMVTSPDLPEHNELSEIEATFDKTQVEDGQWHMPDSYRLVSLKAVVTLPVKSGKET